LGAFAGPTLVVVVAPPVPTEVVGVVVVVETLVADESAA